MSFPSTAPTHGRAVAIAAAVTAAELLVAGWIGFVTWLMSHWMIDDATAMQMTDADWNAGAASRAAIALAVGAAIALLFAPVHRRWAAPAFARSRWFARLPWLMGATVATAGAIGAVQFAIERPFV